MALGATDAQVGVACAAAIDARTSTAVDRVLRRLDTGRPGLCIIAGGTRDERAAVVEMVANTVGRPVTLVSLELAKRLLDIPLPRRPLAAVKILADLVRSGDGGTSLLDDLEFSFAPSLRLDPLQALRGAARNREVVATWPGTVRDRHLVYARVGHPEYRSYPIGEESLVNLQGAGSVVRRLGSTEEG